MAFNGRDDLHRFRGQLDFNNDESDRDKLRRASTLPEHEFMPSL